MPQLVKLFAIIILVTSCEGGTNTIGVYNAGLDIGAFAGPIAGGLLASTMGIPAMFRIIPMGLVIAYLIAVFLVTQTEKRALDRALVK